MTKKDTYYLLAILEEIRNLSAQNLLVNARIYDKLRMDGVPEDTPAYDTCTEIADKSFKLINDLHEKLEKI